MPPQTATRSCDSKTRNRLPEYSRSDTCQCRTNGQISRSSAATIATSGIALRPKPCGRASQSIVNRNNLPAEFALCLRRGNKHFLAAHPHRIDGRPWFSLSDPARDHFIANSRRQRQHIRHFHAGGRQPSDRGQLIQNLLQREVLTPEDVAFPASSLLQS